MHQYARSVWTKCVVSLPVEKKQVSLHLKAYSFDSDCRPRFGIDDTQRCTGEGAAGILRTEIDLEYRPRTDGRNYAGLVTFELLGRPCSVSKDRSQAIEAYPD